ncbi:MAG: tetratricopeptide repeat protein [Anaerolineales bacterium]|nr:tetratricopeptide repeat protein [Anaerolineales bacterium]
MNRSTPDLSSITVRTVAVERLADSAFLTQLVDEALRTYQNTLALSRSALANSVLVTPVLVKDDASPTVEERGHGLRLVLQWAVNQLAPAPPAFPLGVFRPLDDPTWRDPLWWRYNILRHRYLEPLHPDDFVGGGRFTETLLALTGISSADAFFDERNRAIHEVAEWLRRQLLDDAYSGELQQLAIQEALAPVKRHSQAGQLLAMAAIFDDVFAREQLLELARRKDIDRAEQVLDDVIAGRFLLTDDGGANLWLSPVLRAYLYARQPTGEMQRRHRLIAARNEAEGRLLPAVRHHQRGGDDGSAARLLLPAAATLFREIQPAVLIDLLQAFNLRQLENGERYAIALLLSDLLHRTGKPEEALAACRQALPAARTAEEQARVYRRIGKLYESRNQQHALRYYQQAIERFAPDAPELAEALKDRGWLYFLRQEWQDAEADLLRALDVMTADARALQGAIYDAMANLYRKTEEPARAVRYAELALALREEEGDLLGVAKSHGNLGLLYRSVGDYAHAIAAYTEAMSTYARIGNQELVAVALLNIGAAFFLSGDVEEAVRRYRASLAISQMLGLALLEIKVQYNLAEAYAALGRPAVASEHWQLGYSLCHQHAFDDQAQDFIELGAALALPLLPSQPMQAASAAPPEALDPEAATVLELAQREHKITAQRLIEVLHVSRATATRRLSALVEQGYLRMEGKGRGVHYRLASEYAAEPPGLIDAATRIEELEARVRQLAPTLHAQFGARAIGVILSPAPPSGLVRLVARFETTPDLEHFFALEQELGDALRFEIDLVPESALDRQSSVRWL